ncbi:MAG: DUF5615 family PIN-like protein [Nitrososphaerota archaeon]|nr:DUF5615 family PIN-like protein [Candidatus Brockarchaeota archaeon]
MRFLVDADLPYSLIEIISEHGHEAISVRDTLGSVTDEEVFNYANRNELKLIRGFLKQF